MAPQVFLLNNALALFAVDEGLGAVEKVAVRFVNCGPLPNIDKRLATLRTLYLPILFTLLRVSSDQLIIRNGLALQGAIHLLADYLRWLD